LALVEERRIAMAARIPMMIMTTKSSKRVKPSSRSSMALRMRADFDRPSCDEIGPALDD